MRRLLLASLLLNLAGCASFRARMWARGSDWADELDGIDDVPSVEFRTETDTPENNHADEAH